MRAFFAINFTDTTKARIADAIRATGIEDPPWRWVARENLHITLKFLGNVADGRVASLERAVGQVCRPIGPFRIALGGLGGFPNLERPRVLFYRLTDGAEPLARLAEGIDDALSALGFERERRPFRGHVTVARIKTPPARDLTDALAGAPAVSKGSETITSVALMESRLGRQGARYHCLKEIALIKPK